MTSESITGIPVPIASNSFVNETVSYATSWRFIEPAVLIEAYPTRPGELAALTSEADKLVTWYNATLLGKELKTHGGGPPRQWYTADECRTAVVKAIRYQLGQRSANLQESVAAQLGYSVSGLRDNLRYFYLDWRELVQEARARR